MKKVYKVLFGPYGREQFGIAESIDEAKEKAEKYMADQKRMTIMPGDYELRSIIEIATIDFS